VRSWRDAMYKLAEEEAAQYRVQFKAQEDDRQHLVRCVKGPTLSCACCRSIKWLAFYKDVSCCWMSVGTTNWVHRSS
jgi:hypothetical protein